MFSIKRPTITRGVLAGGAAVLIGASSIGVAFAQQAPPAPQSPAALAADGGHGSRLQAFIDALAGRLGISSDTLRQAIKDTRTELGVPAGRLDGRAEALRAVLHQAAAVAAQAIGISVDQLKQELPNKSLAQVAQAHGKTPADVAAALKNAAHQRIDQAAAGGKLTADQAAQWKARADHRIDKLMNRVVPQRRGG